MAKPVKCPHCGAVAVESNRFLYRCTAYDTCGRYIDSGT